MNQGMIAPGNHCYLKIRCALQHPRGKVRAFGAKQSDKLLFLSLLPQSRVQGIPEAVAEEVEADLQQCDKGRRKKENMGKAP